MTLKRSANQMSCDQWLNRYKKKENEESFSISDSFNWQEPIASIYFRYILPVREKRKEYNQYYKTKQ